MLSFNHGVERLVCTGNDVTKVDYGRNEIKIKIKMLKKKVGCYTLHCAVK